MPVAARVDAGVPALRPRVFGDACLDALPDAIACAACALAWARPQAIAGVDLVGWAAPLFLIQVPLSVLTLFVGVTRLPDAVMARAWKAGFVLAPAVGVAASAAALFGIEALACVLLLSATTLWRITAGDVDREAPVPGAWLTIAQGGRRWRVPAGHRQFMASLTLIAALLLTALLPFVGVERFGMTPAIEAASSWSQGPVGAVVGAHFALAAGVALFSARCLLQFDGIAQKSGSPDAAPPPRIEDDPVLREIAREVDRNTRD